MSRPVAASDIAFWDDGCVEIVRFSISEPEFVKIFEGKVIFEEIVISKPYGYSGFGNPEIPPYRNLDRVDMCGLYFESNESDGGGFDIVYDRDMGVGYVFYACN